ncbi:MAG: hypothetical protein GXZ04_01955 [Clostridiales bacterium]|nr:hypothetical protein [Clostridiales bacterium]
MNFLQSFDFESTIRDFDFTRKARQQISHVVTSATFADMDAQEVYSFLAQGMEMVSFKDQLKRYLYQRAEIEEPFNQVQNAVYQDILLNSFEENNAPHSFGPTTTRFQSAVKSWLASERVRRETVFLLGFGLNMQVEDVERYLTRVLSEDSFRAGDPTETIFRYCFHHRLPYARALDLQAALHASPAPKMGPVAEAGNYLDDEAALLAHLSGISIKEQQPAKLTTLQQFQQLYRRCQAAISTLYNSDEEEKPKDQRRVWQPEDIGPADLEQALCSGIPMSPSGNLSRASLSLLNKQFASYRPSRQRLTGILKQQQQADRYDLMTLTFFLHAQEDRPGEERLTAFMDETNELLRQCGLGPLYPVNPYDAFLLICTYSDCPLAMYTEVWELSYQTVPAN